MSWPAPTREAHQQFCLNEGWRRVRDAKGRTGTHHVTFEFDLPDGRILRTRASHPPDRTTYGAGVWRHVLRDQLDVSESEFWACVQDRTKPGRGLLEVPAEALPLEVVLLLRSKVGLSEAAIAAMTKDEAIARLNKFWTEGV